MSTDVSVQPNSPIFRGQYIQEENLDSLTLEDESDRLSRNVGTELPEERKYHLHRAGSIKLRRL
jgi:hypothetical protein